MKAITGIDPYKNYVLGGWYLYILGRVAIQDLGWELVTMLRLLCNYLRRDLL
jgi:hypothetical protein